MEHPLIVVGTDFSEGALIALLNGRSLASRLGGEVRLVHIFDSSSGGLSELDETARDWLERCDFAPGRLITRQGTAWLELAREARSQDATMIVVGCHGRSGYQPIELGSTAARVGLAAHCPVMLVGDRVQGRRPQRFGPGDLVARVSHS